MQQSNAAAPVTAPFSSNPWPVDKIERWPIERLTPYVNNPNTHPPEQIDQIVASIRENGWTNPILIDEDGGVIAGHGRIVAAERLGIKQLPVMIAVGWTAEQKRKHVIADNQIPRNSAWDYDLLKIELGELQELGADLSQIGFTEPQLLALTSETVLDPHGEWSGMPEFEQEDKSYFQDVVLHFVDQAAVDKFASILGVKITKNTRSLTYPKLEIESYVDKRYVTTPAGAAPASPPEQAPAAANGPSAAPAAPAVPPPSGVATTEQQGPPAPVFRYGDALPAGFNIPKSFAWVLGKDLTEAKNPFAAVQLRAGARVMDCGGCIGTFSAAALEQGASTVRIYEPVAKNADLIAGNLARYGDRAQLVRAALAPDDRSSVELCSSGFPGSHSVVPREKAKGRLVVAAVNFRTELLAFKPDVVKLDIEGAEYDLLEHLQPGDLAGVSCLFIEFHPAPDHETRGETIRKRLAGEGFVVVQSRKRAYTLVRK